MEKNLKEFEEAFQEMLVFAKHLRIILKNISPLDEDGKKDFKLKMELFFKDFLVCRNLLIEFNSKLNIISEEIINLDKTFIIKQLELGPLKTAQEINNLATRDKLEKIVDFYLGEEE